MTDSPDYIRPENKGYKKSKDSGSHSGPHLRPSDLKQAHIKNNAHGWLGLAAGLVVVIIAVVWLVVGLVDRVIMPLVVLSSVERQVPNLHHLSLEEADSICCLIGLELVRGRVRVDNRLPPGSVLDQFPVAGVSVKPGRRVEVITSGRERLIACPDAVGRSPREAMLMADSSGLVVVENHIRYSHSSRYPEGVVMVQRPLPMTGMMRGDELTLTVSLGPRPTETVAPELVGRRISEVGVILAKHNLRLGKVTRYPDSSVPSGTVISQSPEPGSPMKPGEKVNVSVTKEPVKGIKD